MVAINLSVVACGAAAGEQGAAAGGGGGAAGGGAQQGSSRGRAQQLQVDPSPPVERSAADRPRLDRPGPAGRPRLQARTRRAYTVHGVKCHHRVYGHKTIAVLWV